MKYSKDLIGINVLIICEDDTHYYNGHFYCKYIIGKIISYNPANNNILIEFYNSNKIRKFFTLIDYEDPFIFHNKDENRLTYKEPEDNRDLWYDVYSGIYAISILKNNIENPLKLKVYEHYVLSKTCYRNKTKKSFFESLLNILTNK